MAETTQQRRIRQLEKEVKRLLKRESELEEELEAAVNASVGLSDDEDSAASGFGFDLAGLLGEEELMRLGMSVSGFEGHAGTRDQ